jgi:hypothetical protein
MKGDAKGPSSAFYSEPELTPPSESLWRESSTSEKKTLRSPLRKPRGRS